MIFTIKNVIQETPDTKSFVLEDTNGEMTSCRSGQFLTFLMYDRNGEELRRSYSLSSSPELEEPITITVKRIPNGIYSRLLHDNLVPGDELQSIGASGFFTLPENLILYNQLVFFAAGSGITPVFSMIKTTLFTHLSTRVLLIYSNRTEISTVFYHRLKLLQHEFPSRFTVEFLFSTAADLSRARLNFDLVERLTYRYVDSTGMDKVLFYLCGPYDYMRMITIKLLTLGVPGEKIRKEIFFVQKVKEKLRPPDVLPHLITVNLNQVQHSFVSQYPDSILKTAGRVGIELPYSCEAGQCGSCAVTCVEGQVWMSHNEVLLDDEIAKGRVLTCTGYAIGGDVSIRI